MKDPHSLEAERAVLGAILIDPGAMKVVSPMLESSDFYKDSHGEIYSGMMALYGNGAVIDLVTLLNHFKGLKRLEKIGGAGYLSELADECPSSANVTHYIKIVKEMAVRRSIIGQAREIAVAAQGPGPVEEIPTKLPIERNHSIEINQASAAIKQLNVNIANGYPGLPPCYDLLARTIRKVSPGHLWIVGAYTSIGKSAWLVDFICRMYCYGLTNPGIAIFSTEMSSEQYLLRCLSNHTKIPTWVITENKCTPDQTRDLIKAQVFFSERNLYLYDRLYRVEDIERTARMLKDRGLNIIAIDYLQNMWGNGTIYERMSRLAPILQYLAKDLQITVIALSQVSNEHVKDRGSGIFGFKGAGEIAASADLAIELERDQAVKEKLIFKVVKNRHGRVGEGCLKYIHGYVKFDEIVEEDHRYDGG